MKTIIANWKTTVVGTATAVLTMLQTLGLIHLTTEQITSIVGALAAIGLIFAKDGNVTGGTAQQ